MTRVGLEPIVGPGQHGLDPRGIHHPTGPDRSCTGHRLHLEGLITAGSQGNGRHRSRTPNLRTRFFRPPEHFFVHHRAVDEERWNGGQITPTDFRTVTEILRLSIGEPKAQTVLGQLRLREKLCQPEHAAQKIGTHFDRCLTDATLESLVLLDHHNPQSGILAPEQKRRRRATQRTADHRDVTLGDRLCRCLFHALRRICVST